MKRQYLIVLRNEYIENSGGCIQLVAVHRSRNLTYSVGWEARRAEMTLFRNENWGYALESYNNFAEALEAYLGVAI